MTPTERQALLQSIATTTADYQHAAMTPAHINKWVSQFGSAEQDTILVELDGILKEHYLSRQKAIGIIRRAVTHGPMIGHQPQEAIRHTRFPQGDGTRSRSQHDLLLPVEEAVQAEYGLSIAECGTSPTAYFYLDDCLFTGRTAQEDLRALLRTMERGTTLWVFFLAAYARGLQRLINDLNPVARNRGVMLIVKQARLYRDDLFEGKCDVLWPMAFSGDPHVDTYVQQRVAMQPHVPLFRPQGKITQETLFSSPQARDVVERAFLKAGAYINSLPENPSPLMRPLGYIGFGWPESLGFGSMFVSYRNCPNNTPLALWWGNPSLHPNHPLSLSFNPRGHSVGYGMRSS